MMLGASEFVAPLKLIATLVNDMEECDDLCKHVHARMTVIHDKLLAMETQKTLPPDKVVRDYRALVNDFKRFLTKHKSRLWVYRVVMAKRVTGKVRNFQERINTLTLALEVIHIGAMADERAAMESFRAKQAAHEAAVTAKLERAVLTRLTDDATVTKAVLRVEHQAEALNVLVHELNKLKAPGGAPPAEDAPSADERLLTTALHKVMRRSQVHVRTVPAWFCPPHDVEFDATAPFAGGSFGTVHYGRMDHMDVVVKCLLADTRTNEVATKQFRDEASLWFGFRHRNVLMMYGACDVSSPPFIVCELASNGNLFDYLSFESNRPQTLRLLHEAASGLAYLHSKRVVHGDLKGDNILVTADGCAKVADFSFSYIRSMSASRSSAAHTGAGGMKAGAIRWRAPECLRGRSPTFASDVFSFGMCILEVVGQAVPWGYHVDDLTVRELVKEGELPERPAAMSDRVWDLVTRMCSLEPSDRPSLASVLIELRELADDAAQATSVDSTVADMMAMTIGELAEPRATSALADPPSIASVAKSLEQAIAEDDAECVATLLSSTASLEESVSSDWNATPLLVAAATGATSVTKMLLASGANIDAQLTHASAKLPDLDDTGWTAVHVAAHAGHAHVVEVLLATKRALVSAVTEKQRSAMYFAARFGHVAVLEVLQQYGADSDVCCSSSGKSALAVAAEFGQVECVEALLLQHKADVHAKSKTGSTALHHAAQSGQADVIAALLRHGARIEEVDNNGSTPLHRSANNGQLEATRVLLQRSANVHAKIRHDGSTALHQATLRGHVDVIEELLRHGARIEELDDNGRTALYWSAGCDQPASVRTLLLHNANVHAQRATNGYTTLHIAAEKGHVAVIEELLRHGARIEEVDNSFRTPLHRSAISDQVESTRVLLQHGANVNAKNRRSGATALHAAVENGFVDIVEELLRHGAHIEEPDNMGWTPLHWSAHFSQPANARALLQHDANANAKISSTGATALHVAAENGHVDVMEELLRRGARVDELDNEGRTPLHWSAIHGQLASARVLLQHSADVHAKISSNGTTALHVAAENNHVDVTEELLRRGARVDELDNEGRTPLLQSACRGRLESARVLLQHNANVHAKFRILNGTSLLHQAAAGGHVDVIEELLRHGARIEEPDEDGRTALYWSAGCNQLESVRTLLQHGANVHTKSMSNGYTALFEAAYGGYVDIVQLLLDAGAFATREHVKVAKQEGHSQVVQMLEPLAPSLFTRLFG